MPSASKAGNGRVAVTLKPELLEALKERAEREGRSLAGMAARAIQLYLKDGKADGGEADLTK